MKVVAMDFTNCKGEIIRKTFNKMIKLKPDMFNRLRSQSRQT